MPLTVPETLDILAGITIIYYTFNNNEENDNEIVALWSLEEHLWWLLGYWAYTVALGNLTLEWSFYEQLLPVVKGLLRAVQRFLGLEARRCSYCQCLALRVGEGVGQQGQLVWVCPGCR